MSAAEQLDFPDLDVGREERRRRIWALIKDIAARTGPKSFASAIRTTRTTLTSALAGNHDRHRLPGEAILLALELGQTHELLRELAAIRECDVHAVREPDALEQLEDLRAALDESLGPDLRGLVYAAANRRGGPGRDTAGQLEDLRAAIAGSLSDDLLLLVMTKARRKGPRRADGSSSPVPAPELRKGPISRREP